jgi:hypothetical protein
MQRLFLRAFVALVVSNAVLGSVVLLVGGLDGTGGKIFATSLLATGAMLLAIACSTGLRAARGRLISQAGIGLAGVAFALLSVGLWTETDDTWFARLAGSSLLLAVFAAGVSLVSLAVVSDRHRWLQTVDVALAALLAAAMLTVIWVEEAATDWFFRVTGVVAIGVAACTLLLPVLHRVAARERDGGQVRNNPTSRHMSRT